MARSKSTEKSTETEVPVGALITQPHGGAIRNGGTNKGGPGRPPSALRERLTGSFEQRVPILEEIADGIPYQRIDVSLATVLKHAHCPICGEKLKSEADAAELALLTIEATASASVNDRLKSIDLMGKYGPGSVKAVTEDDVRERVKQQMDLILAKYPTDLANEILDTIEPVWSGE